MNGHRKLLGYVVAVLAIVGLSMLGLTPKGLDTAVYGVVACLGLYVGGNVGEHAAKRPGVATPPA